MKKGQIATDFIIVLILVLVLFIFTFTIIDKRNTEYSLSEIDDDARKLADDVAFSINDVFFAGDNSNLALFMPDTLPGSIDYNLSVYPDSRIVEIRYNQKHYTSKLLSSNVYSGLVSKGDILIENQDGYIQIT